MGLFGFASVGFCCFGLVLDRFDCVSLVFCWIGFGRLRFVLRRHVCAGLGLVGFDAVCFVYVCIGLIGHVYFGLIGY